MLQLSFPTINWRRGALRFWIVLSLLWCGAVMVTALNRIDVAWPFVSVPKVHVKISNTETWDYPPEWGVDRIEADLKRRLADLDRKDREWADSVSEARKAECRAIPDTTPFANQPDDCVRLFFSKSDRAAPSGWEAEVRQAPVPISQVIIEIAPWAIIPPLLVIALGISVFWAVAGFKR